MLLLVRYQDELSKNRPLPKTAGHPSYRFRLIRTQPTTIQLNRNQTKQASVIKSIAKFSLAPS